MPRTAPRGDPFAPMPLIGGPGEPFRVASADDGEMAVALRGRPGIGRRQRALCQDAARALIAGFRIGTTVSAAQSGRAPADEFDDDEDPDLAFVDDPTPGDDEDGGDDDDNEDEDDQDEDESDRPPAGRVVMTSPPVPGRPNPQPDPPADPDEQDPDLPDDEGDDEKRKPGRD